LRSRRRRRGGALRHLGHQGGPVLLDPGGARRPRGRAKELDDAVAELVAEIAALSPLSLAVGKEGFYAQVDLAEHEAYEVARATMAANAVAGDAQEGMCAFVEKRHPEWRGV
jgi:enoyl-CoA hydratase/carnithine racemase